MTWIEKRLEEDAILGCPSKVAKKKGKRYYVIHIADEQKVLIQDRGPHKHDYSVNIYYQPEQREIIEPKTREEYKIAAKDRKWKYSRAVIASDEIAELPNIDDFLLVDDYEVLETKHEIISKKTDVSEEIQKLAKKEESSISELVDNVNINPGEDTLEEDEFIVVPGEITISPRKRKRDSVTPALSVSINIQEEEGETVQEMAKRHHEQDMVQILEDGLEKALVEDKSIDNIPTPSTSPISPTEEVEADIPLEVYDEPEVTPAIIDSFRSFETMYEDLAGNQFNPVGILNKEPGTGKYMELEWMLKHFNAKQDSGRAQAIQVAISKYN